VPVFMPSPSLCTDNAAMIAVCGYYRYLSGKTDGYAGLCNPRVDIGWNSHRS